MRKYSFNETLMILETEYTGILNIEDIIGHYEKIGNDDALSDNLKVLIDCRDARMDLKVIEINQTHDVVLKALKRHKYIKEAIIVDKPIETVMAILFRDHNRELKKYSFRIFSTEEAARGWLLEVC